jgi:lactate dehydrogenase-like 2-hydroxyacid dehydrogenase
LAKDFSIRLNEQDKLYTSKEIIELAAGADAIVPCHTEILDAATIEQLAGNIKIIANFSVGYDHVDTEAARTHGVVVTNTPDVLSDATAEIAILIMLGAARRASEGEQLVRTATWGDWSPSFMVGRQITGKRIGIVGMGRVGQVVADRARGFNMQVHYHNRRQLSGAQEKGAVFHEQLEEMLPLCDVLSLHCPATPATTNLLDEKMISLLPKGAIVVNTARGALVDDDALIAALHSGHIGAAGLDVFNNEPDIHPDYRTLKNTFLLPHIGSATHETRNAMGFRVIENLTAFFAGDEPRDRVA